jgi:polysaccharide pyruvyl transferase WcaK-like protein
VSPQTNAETRSTISLLGASLDVGNRGVLALAESVATLIADLHPRASIVFHYSHSHGGQRLVARDGSLNITVRNCRLSPRSALSEHIGVILLLAILHRLGIRRPATRNPWLRSLLNASFIGDIRGGDSFSDIYGFWRFFSGSLPLLTVVALGRPFTMLPQTYGPFRRRASRWLAAILLRAAASIWTRDRRCSDIVRHISGKPVTFCPDVAFTLTPRQPTAVTFAPAAPDWRSASPLVAVNISGLLYMGGYTRANMFGLRSDYRVTAEIVISRLLEQTPSRLMLLPHTFGAEYEEEACAELFASFHRRYPERLFLLTTPLGPAELKWLIGRTSFVVASRMHACIAAMSQSVPTVGLGYSDKFLGVFESAGVGDAVVDLRLASSHDVAARVLSAFTDRPQVRRRLDARMTRIRNHVVDAFKHMIAPFP